MPNAHPPIVTYTSIKIANTDIALSSTVKASFNAPYNSITVTFKASTSLTRFDIGVTAEEDDNYDIGVGLIPSCTLLSLAANTTYTVAIPINATYFSGSPSNTYRVSLYAQNQLDYSWDITHLFMALASPGSTQYKQFNPQSSDGMEVQVIKQI